MLKDQAAAQYLADLACDVIFRHPGPLPWADLQHSLAVRLTVDPALLREVLAADPRFLELGGRWDLAPRPLVPDRPLGGALADLLECFGRPMPRVLVIAELGLSRTGAPPQISELLDRLLAPGRDLACVDDCLYRTSWLANLSTTDPQGQLFLNELTDDERFIALRKKLSGPELKQRQVVDTALAVLKAAKIPLHNRALGLVLSAHHGDRFRPAEAFAQMCCDERLLCLSGPLWALRTHEPAWRRALAGGGAEAPDEEPLDIVEVLQAPPAQRMRLEPAVLLALQELATAARTPVSVEEGVRGVVGLRPRQRQFAAAAQAVDAALASDLTLARVRPGFYLRRDAVPPWVGTIPEALLPVPPGARGADSELVPLSDLPDDLVALVTDPFHEDLGETEVRVAQEPLQQTQLVLAWHHHRLGTLPLRACDRRFFDLPSAVTVLTLVTPGGQRWAVWANSRTGLLYGLLTWYGEALPVSGAVLTLSRGAQPGTLLVEVGDELDHAAHIGEERLAHLLAQRQRLEHRPATLPQTVAAVLHGLPRGLVFDALWYQLNVVRRTTRHQLASALVSGGEAFTQDSGRRWRVVP